MSGIIFSFAYPVMYGTSRTLGTVYEYNALKIGFVLTTFGVGKLYTVAPVGDKFSKGQMTGNVLGRIMTQKEKDAISAEVLNLSS